MSTTDTRTGFRLPWSGDRDLHDEPGPSASAEAATEVAGDPDGASTAGAWPSTDLRGRGADDHDPAPTRADDGEAAAPEPAAAPHRRPTKFLADLTAAMRTAAEAARAQAIEQFQADTKSVIDAIHDASAGEVVGLRARADDDVTAVREWSKAEIARIREETDARIARRRQALEGELEAHAADVERRIERVHGAVAAYEGEMTAFFERLFAEADPARFAAMAETMPEPPALADVQAELPGAAGDATLAVDAWPTEEDAVVGTPDAARAGDPTQPAAVEPASDTVAAATEQAVEADAPAPTDAPAPAAWADLDAAEAEAALAARLDASGADEGAFVSRLAGLGTPTATEGAGAEPRTSRIVVTGLVSVASIASFKRHLGRAAGIQAVSVSSGPDGEFVFAASHHPDVDVRDIVPTLPGFGARVTHASDDVVTVTAHDPESDG